MFFDRKHRTRPLPTAPTKKAVDPIDRRLRGSTRSAVLLAVPLGALLVALVFAGGLAGQEAPGIGTKVGYLLLLAALSVAAFLYRSIRRASVKEMYNRIVFERAADAILTTDVWGKIELWNPAAQRIFGYRDSELIGFNIMVLLTSAYTHEEDGDLWDSLRTNAIQATGVAQEVIGLRKDGEKFFMDLSISEAHIGGQSMFVAIIRDVTERKRAQIAIRKAHDQLERRVEERTSELQEVNRQLVAEIRERKRTEAERGSLVVELQDALTKIKTLRGLIPICASCKKVRDDEGFWNQIEVYIKERSEAEFSHGICPDCADELYSQYREKEDSEPVGSEETIGESG